MKTNRFTAFDIYKGCFDIAIKEQYENLDIDDKVQYVIDYCESYSNFSLDLTTALVIVYAHTIYAQKDVQTQNNFYHDVEKLLQEIQFEYQIEIEE